MIVKCPVSFQKSLDDYIYILRVGSNLNEWMKDQMLETIISITEKCSFFDLHLNWVLSLFCFIHLIPDGSSFPGRSSDVFFAISF